MSIQSRQRKFVAHRDGSTPEESQFKFLAETRSRAPASRLPLILILAMLLLGSIFFASPAHAQDKSLVWEQFDTDIVVNLDGSMDIAEHQTIRFTDGTFTFGYRDIPVQNFDYIDGWAVTDSSGNSYQLSNDDSTPYTFSVDDEGYRYVIRWQFPPIANAAETYTLSYKVHGGLRFYEGGDQVWWKAIYGDRSFPVLDGRVRVTVPTPAQIHEWAAYINGGDARDSATAQVSSDNATVLYELQTRLQGGEEFEVRVEFTDGVVDGVTPAWQAQADAQAAAYEEELAFQRRWGPIATLGFGVLAVLLILGGPVLLYAFWHRFGRDAPVEIVADYLPEPPEDLPPGMVGTLLDERADMEDIVATIVDLARRQAVSITEEKEESFFRNRTDFIYRRERADVELRDYEIDLLKALFGSKQEVRLSDLKNKFYSQIPQLKKDLYAAVEEAGFFTRSPETVRSQYGCLGVVGLVFAFATGVALSILFSSLTAAAVLPAIGIGVTAFGLLILSRHMPRKTPSGAETAARWEAFRRYLENIDKYSDLDEQKDIWDRWLPYAIAFGIDKGYIRKFERVDAPAPGWYIPSPDLYGPYRRRYYGQPWIGGPATGGPMIPGGGLGRGEGGSFGGRLGDASKGMGSSLAGMSTGLGAMLASASSTMTSRPASTSSGGGWSSGGGGFSGGGSFGGGGGGGGGGGFG